MQDSRFFTNISEFDPNLDDWEYYIDRFINFATINAVDKNDWVILLLSVIGRVGHKTITDLVMPAKAQDFDFDKLLPILSDHWKPKTLPIVERVKFAKIFQQENENISDFTNRLRAAAQHCNFGKFLDEALCDKLVSGLNSNYSPVQDASSLDNYNFQETLVIVKSKEVALHERLHIRNNKIHNDMIYNVQEKKQGFKCIRCGDTDHYPSECQHINIVCLKCKKTSHIARACLQGKKKKFPRNIKLITANTVDNNNSTSINNFNYSCPLFCSIRINNAIVKGEIDTGAVVSILSWKDYQRIGGKLH